MLAVVHLRQWRPHPCVGLQSIEYEANQFQGLCWPHHESHSLLLVVSAFLYSQVRNRSDLATSFAGQQIAVLLGRQSTEDFEPAKLPDQGVLVRWRTYIKIPSKAKLFAAQCPNLPAKIRPHNKI